MRNKNVIKILELIESTIPSGLDRMEIEWNIFIAVDFSRFLLKFKKTISFPLQYKRNGIIYRVIWNQSRKCMFQSTINRYNQHLRDSNAVPTHGWLVFIDLKIQFIIHLYKNYGEKKVFKKIKW